jgi:peptidoglycan hydrolase CwlO-like protein
VKRPLPHSLRTLAAIIATTLATALAVAPVHADTQSDLNAAEARLDNLLKKISAEESVVSGLEAQANVLAETISRVQDRIANTQRLMIKVEREIQAAETQIEATQQQLDQRARVAYESGPGTGLEFLLGSTSLADLNDRLQIVNGAAQSDTDLIDQIQAQKAQLATKQSNLQMLENTLRSTQADLSKQQDALESKLSEAQGVVAKLDNDREAAARQVRALKAKRAREIYLAKLAAEQSKGGGGSSIGGVLLTCPVASPHAYYDDFGAPRYGGGFHHHAGNDIFAPRGTPIRAPFDGIATEDSNGLGGTAVVVTGELGFVYNAHLDSIGQLGAVSMGTVVGYVGDSGDALGGATHDHFEWHPNVIPDHPYKSSYGFTLINGAIDPFPYLNSVC